MAWTYQQLFNTLNAGDLNGQDSWSGSTNFDLSTTAPYEGAQCVESVLNIDSAAEIGRVVTAVMSGTVYVSVKINRTAGNIRRGGVLLYIGATLVGRLEIGQTSSPTVELLKWNGSSNDWVTISSTFNNNTWYRFGFQWANSSNQYRVNIDNGTFSSYYTFVSNTAIGSGITQIAFLDNGNNGNGTGTVFWDTISPDYTPAAAGPANLKSLNTNVIANIKSFNTNVIANIKSINTNV
jgi:hypothetical protein